MVEETPWQQSLRYVNRPNPYPFYEELRNTPVSRQPDGSYVVSTYREIVQLLHDPRVTSDPRKRPPEYQFVNPFDGMIIAEDPPEHDVGRRRMMRHFGPPVCPHMIADLEPEISRITGELLDKMIGKTRIDLVEEFAFPLPVTMICKVLGVPAESIPRFHGWIENALDGVDFGPEATDPEQLRRAEKGVAEVAALREFMTALLDQYAKQPGPGMLSAMVHEKDPQERMAHGELVRNAMLMLFAGHETSVNLISHSVLTMLRHSQVHDQLRRRPELVVPAVEEFLRLESSVQIWHTRAALGDIDLADTTIPKGSPIFLAYGSANRDPERFVNPDHPHLERPDNEHVGFSQGIHYCFGAPLARLEVQVALREFVRRVENPRVVEDPPPYRRNQIFRGPYHLLLDIDGIRD
ncbi:cytochrome P450 [Actinopolymorpha singaporensis]